MKSLAQARIKRNKALELAAEGCSYSEIARRAGYAHRGSAHRAVFKALDEREVVGVDQLRELELDRLDCLQAGLWETALGGDTQAASAVIRIIEARTRLLGLQVKSMRSDKDEVVTLVLDHHEGNPGEETATI